MDYVSGCTSGFSVYVKNERAQDALISLVECISSGSSTVEEIASVLGISEPAVKKRIYKARNAGYNIVKERNGKYSIAGTDRTCKKCGKRLAKLNHGKYCFNYPECKRD